MLSINTVAAKLGLSVHQLRRWELMFGLEIKRGRGQQRQYRPEDLTVLERIKELVEQGWPTSQIRPQLEAEGLITPKLIGVPQQPGNPEMLMEAIIGLRSFSERRFIEISKQIDELRQLMISITLRNELKNEMSSPWQPVEEEFAPMPAPANMPAQEISIGPSVDVGIPSAPPQTVAPAASYSLPKTTYSTAPVSQLDDEDGNFDEDELGDEEEEIAELPVTASTNTAAVTGLTEASSLFSAAPLTPAASIEAKPPTASPAAAPPAATLPTTQVPTASAPSSAAQPRHGLGEVTDQNYLTVLGKALDMIGWSDEQADQYSQNTFSVSHWDELGRSQAEKLISHLLEQMG